MDNILPNGSTSQSLLDILAFRVQTPTKGLYRFLPPDSAPQEISYATLDQWAGAIAADLSATYPVGTRVLIVCPPGLGYIAAFFGCLYAGMVAVPAYPLIPGRVDRLFQRLDAIVRNADAQIALTTEEPTLLIENTPLSAAFQGLQWLNINDYVNQSIYFKRHVEPESLAFLMYTSGSTGNPKGVQVSHANAIHNLRAFPGFAQRPCRSIVSWLPLFHDLGLFLGVLHPLYQGVPATLMAPEAFIRNPAIWLEALTTYHGTTTGGPNFAYDLCVRKITPEQRATLDLQAWNLALNGAEPIRADVLERFSTTFAPVGFQPTAFYPSYGMADATATVTGPVAIAPPTVIYVERAALRERRVHIAPSATTTTAALVGCGSGLADQTIQIVDPEHLTPCAEEQIGEIWVAGPSIGAGYWQEPDTTAETFGAKLVGSETSYLRTGDLGFWHAGALFIAGRLKDVIIIRGENHYPEDLEQTIDRSHPAIRAGCGVAFALEQNGTETLAIVQEVAPDAPFTAIIDTIRQAITTHHGILAEQITLISPGSLPKTSSGKLQRRRTREWLLADSFTVLAQWKHHPSTSPPAPAAATIMQWLKQWLVQHTGIDSSRLDPSMPLSHFNLDSLAAVSMLGELERELGRTLDPTLLWQYPTLASLAAHLSGNAPAASPTTVDPSRTNEPIAIIGMACDFPGAPNLDAFWNVLREQRDSITEIPADRWNAAELYDPELRRPGTLTTRWGGFLDATDTFDAGLFGISPREAPHIDPQHRKLLEVTWAALEHAGEAPDRLAGSTTGVFIGICNSDFARIALADDTTIGQYGGTGTAYSLAANRISYSLDLLGPSLVVDTACSSSLVALHLACQSLHNAECDRALIGGVNLILGPEISMAFSHARMMAADGRCKAFDARADGYVRSEGVGVIVAKRLSEALAAGDSILAIIRGSAVRQDGRSNGITAPNGLAQEAVLRQALHRANIQPADLALIEAHGTGTPLGDAVEIAALTAVLGPQNPPIALGSVKTNIGHTEAAAGIAGLIKVLLAMRHNEIPAQLYAQTPNPRLAAATDTLDLVLEARPWPNAPQKRFASVSSFGFGGTIASVIVERPEPPTPTEIFSTRTHHLLVLSGRDQHALDSQVQALRTVLATSDASLAAISHSLGRSRAQLAHRLALVVESKEAAQALLEPEALREPTANCWQSVPETIDEPIVFVFSGQGGQHIGMGHTLYQTNPVFRAAMDACQTLLAESLERPLLDYLYPTSDNERVAEDAWVLQPALFAFEYALAHVWMDWNVRPAAVLGHSMGEYVAACVAGILSLEDALKLVTFRAQCVEQLPRTGAMLAVMASAARVEQHIAAFDGAISVASYNSPSLVIVTGEKTALEHLTNTLTEAEITYRHLPIANAFHSPAMRPIAPQFAELAHTLAHHPPQIPVVANLTGTIAGPTQFNPDYWVQHLLKPVQFQASIECLVEQGYRIFVEIGPQPALTNTIKRIIPQSSQSLILASLTGPYQPDWLMLLGGLGQLFVRGITLDWRAIDRYYTQPLIALPAYPFARDRYPLARRAKQQAISALPERLHPLLDCEVVTPMLPGRVFQRRFEREQDRNWYDHRVLGAAIIPGAAHIEMLLAAAGLRNGSMPNGLRNIAFTAALNLETEPLSQVILDADTGRIVSRSTSGEWTIHTTSEITNAPRGHHTQAINRAAIQQRCTHSMSGADLYARFAASGLDYGPAFRTIQHGWYNETEVIAEIMTHDLEGYHVAPTLLDGAFQALSLIFDTSNTTAPLVPFALDSLEFLGPLPHRVFCYGRRTNRHGGNGYSADLSIFDSTGHVLLQAQGMHVRSLNSPTITRIPPEWSEQPIWQSTPLMIAAREGGNWLVFMDRAGIASALEALIRANGGTLIRVEAGSSFQSTTTGYTIRPDHSADYAALAAALASTPLTSILHLWSYDLPHGWPASSAILDNQLEIGAKSVLNIVRAIATHGDLPAHIGIVTRYAQANDSAPHRPVAPIQAAVWGLSRVVALEYPKSRMIVLDLEDDPPVEQAQRVWDELCAVDQAAGTWAIYQQGQRFTQGFTLAQRHPFQGLPPHGVYLISGGQGGIGLEIARWLTQQTPTAIVLLNRTPLDPTTHPERVQALAELAATGCTIEPITGDISDATHVQAVVNRLLERYGRLDGIIHAAGVLDDALIWNMSIERFERVLRPKIHGTWALGQALHGRTTTQVVLCSSMAAFEPAPGQANHAAANAVEDSLAHCLRRQGQPALSINWGLWGETGVVANERYLRQLAARGIYPLTTAEGLAGLEAALGSGLTQVLLTKKPVGDALDAAALRLASTHQLATLDAATPELTRLCGSYVRNALMTLGLHPLLHQRFTSASLAQQLGIAAHHQQVFSRLLKLLVRLEMLHAEGDEYRLGLITEALDVEQQAVILAEQYPGLASEIALLQRCGNHLADVLSGQRNPLHLLFPNGSLELSSRMYGQSPVAQVYNGLAAAAIAALQQPERPLRVLEVGGGTGGTTEHIIAALDPQRLEYTFTDISQRFVFAAQQAYAAHPFMRYGVLNLEADLLEQGHVQQAYDVIIAANVIHATSKIVDGLTRLGALLAPGGSLVLVELTQAQDWLDLTFGLTDGWWKFNDSDLRPDYPLLDQAGWHHAFTLAGFQQTRVLTPPQTTHAPIQQAVFIASAWQQPSAINVVALPTTQQPIIAAPIRATNEHEPQRWLQERLTSQITSALKLPGLPSAASFHDVGLDSLLAVEITAALRTELGIQISPTVFFEYPSVRELAAYLWRDHGAHLTAPQSHGDSKAIESNPVQVAPSAVKSLEPALDPRSQDIAIIGFACRFPGAADSAAFWDVLCRGAHVVGEIPAERWRWQEHFDPTPGIPNKTYSRWGGYIDDVAAFDARFFSISPKEANLMDPQQRVFLETAWHALEHAGYAGNQQSLHAGVFAGCSYAHYLHLLQRHKPELAINHFAALGNNHAVLANRISYFLNLTGPSVSVDTLCSSSLTALHLACSSLRNGETELALVGGVNLLLDVDHYLSMSQMRAYSADGRCKAFDAQADGFVSGEGVGIVVIKPLAQALSDGDSVYAVIKGSAVTHNGRTSGLTIPQSRNQSAAIRQAHMAAGWDMASVGLIEAHGTGTALGDPIEIEGLRAVFGPQDHAAPPRYIGSVKTNLGHLEAAAGMAGLLKTVLALHHGLIPASLHFETLNPHIDAETLPFIVNTQARPWPTATRRAGVSAFGLGGVNAHVALEAAPHQPEIVDRAEWWVLPLSAVSESALHAMVTRYYHYLLTATTPALDNLCFTAGVGRGHFRHRLALIASSVSDLLDKLHRLCQLDTYHDLSEHGIWYDQIVPESHDGLQAFFEPVLEGADHEALAQAYAKAYIHGSPINWSDLYPHARRIGLPLYPFERQIHWFEAFETAPANPPLAAAEARIHPLLGIQLP